MALGIAPPRAHHLVGTWYVVGRLPNRAQGDVDESADRPREQRQKGCQGVKVCEPSVTELRYLQPWSFVSHLGEEMMNSQDLHGAKCIDLCWPVYGYRGRHSWTLDTTRVPVIYHIHLSTLLKRWVSRCIRGPVRAS